MEMQYTIAENATPDEVEQGRLLFSQPTDFFKRCCRNGWHATS